MANITPHNSAELGDYAKTVLMPGDPKRAEEIAKIYLEDAKLINDVRGMKAYTGFYKGKKVSVMGSGMGIPSMGIYCYELYKYFGVENIIRIGSCGAYIPEVKLLDLILVDNSYTESNFALTLNNEEKHLEEADRYLNEIIEKTAKEQNIDYVKGDTLCSECFDYYMTDINKLFERAPKDLKIIAAEMEAFALFYTAKMLNKKAACILSVVDSHFYKEQVSIENRQSSLDKMIKLALDSSLKLD